MRQQIISKYNCAHRFGIVTCELSFPGSKVDISLFINQLEIISSDGAVRDISVHSKGLSERKYERPTSLVVLILTINMEMRGTLQCGGMRRQTAILRRLGSKIVGALARARRPHI